MRIVLLVKKVQVPIKMQMPQVTEIKKVYFLEYHFGLRGKSNKLYHKGKSNNNTIVGVSCNSFKNGCNSPKFLDKSKSQGTKCSCNMENLK